MKRTERSAFRNTRNIRKTAGRRLALIFAALCVLIVAFGTVFLTQAEEIDAEYVQIGSKTYGIETAMKLVDADLALLQWRAKGSSTAVSAAFNEGTAEEPQYVVLQGFDAVYSRIYDRLLELFETKSDTSVLYSEAAAISDTQINSSTVLWKASGTVTLDYKKTVAGGRLIVLSDDTDDPCSINLTAAASQFALTSGSLAIQARDDEQKIGVTCTYTGSDKTAAAFSVSGGSLYLQNCDIHGFNFSTQSFSTILFPTGNVVRYLYMSDSSLRDVSGKEAPGIFLKVYGGNNSNAKKTRLYINHSRFEDCVTPPGDNNTVGGSAIRSYAADVSQLEVRNSTFYQNRVGSKTAVQSGTGTGGGAIYWKSIDGKAKLISCVFEENHSSVVGGAILNMGTMEIEGCRFVNNKALKNGGAIAAEPPYTSSTYTTITGSTQDAWSKKQETMSGGLTLDENTALIGNEAGMIGGGIYFNAVSSQISSTYKLEKFQMRLIINGAEINGNTAGENGGGVGVYLDYDTNTYTTGVAINAGSRIINNEAAQNGGAIWIKSDVGCDCLSNEGVLMAGGETGRLENNRAINGGAIYIEAGKPSVETMNFYIQSGLVSQNHASATAGDACGGAAYIKGGSVLMSGGSVKSCTAKTYGGAVYVENGSFTMSAGDVLGNESSADMVSNAQRGGAVYVSGGNVEMSGGKIARCKASEEGGAVYMSGGAFTIGGGTISENVAVLGAGAYLAAGEMLVSGGSMAQNRAENGGGAYLGGGRLTVSGGSIAHNEAENGAGAYLASGTMTVTDGSITANGATENGAGAYLAGGTFAISGGVISENTAVLGAGAYLAAGEMLVSGGSITHNSAKDGAGAYLLDGAMTVTDGSITANEATANGAGAYLAGGTFAISGGTVSENVAVLGAGAYLAAGEMLVSGGSITQNEAENGAGAYLASGTMTVTNGSITANEATANGAGAYLAGGTFAISGGMISENTAVLGAGAYLAAGEMLVSGGSITQNSAKDGAGAYLLDGAMTVTDGSITVNEATASGGALYMGGGTFTMKGGSISNNRAENGAGAYLGGGQLTVSGGSITKNYAGIGAGVYLSNGTMQVSENGLITENGFLEEDGAVIATTQKGGGAYISGGDLYVSGGTITKNVAENGAGAFVSDGDVFVTGGVVSENKAVENGGAFSISNGNFTMVGGVLTKNRAGNDGGAIYVSSSQANTAILIRSGSVTYNDAGNSGGALSVYGLDGVEFTITIGSQTNHAGRENAHACSVRLADGDEPCPIVEYNTSAVSGGAIYLSGSYDAVMNMHCLVENGNVVGNGASPSNFMKVDGGSLNIATEGSDGEECGNVVIRSSIQVSHGKVLISGDGENPRFEDSVSVEVAGDATFKDLRAPAVAARTIQYFENLDQAGKYVLIDSLATEAHRVRVSMYAAPGKVMVGWMLMRVENGEYVPTGTVYHADDYITPEQYSGNLIFFAIWEVHGYSVEFLPNANGYTGAMEKQEFAYSVHQNLTPNAYVNPGYRFDHWEDAYRVDENGNKIVFANGQEVWELTDVHEATITLKAIWIVCPHDEMQTYTLTRQTSSLTRTCPCQGYSETVSLPSVTETYREGILRGTAVEQLIPATKTGVYAEKTWNNLEIVYSGITNGGVELSGTTPPTDAGSYTASVTVSEDLAEPIVITATIIIGRADRLDFPNTPQFDDTGKDANGDTVIKITGDYQPGLEYRFVYYDESANAHGEEDWFAWTEENDPPTRVIDHIYTKYYVDVRYAMTPNFNPSGPTRGGFSISYGNVTFNIVTSGGLLIVDTEDAVDQGQMRVEIISATGYYVPSIVESIDSQGYDGFRHQSSFDPESRRWTYVISEIENPQEDIVVTVTLSGAVLNVSIETSTVKNEAFDNIAERAESNVRVSRDSAYTVRFKVAYFAAYYSDPSIAFSTAIPAKTTIIMMDLGDGTYWFYTAETEKERVALSDFSRMGVDFDLAGRENFALQFVVDFSDCASAPEIGELVTRFAATGDEKTSELPSSGDAVSRIRLTETPSFRVEIAPGEDEPLSKGISYEFALTEDGVGVSAWDGVGGLLLLTPVNSGELPRDLRLEVNINGQISLYSLINGKFAIALPSVGGGAASLTLLSNMWQDADQVFRFTLQMCVSATKVTAAPKSNVGGEGIVLEYSISKSVTPPIISASVIGQLPVYDENGAVSLTFGGTVKGLGDGDKLRAVLYFRDDNGRYSSTTQELGADAFTVDGERFHAVLGLDSFKADMKNQVGSLNLMLSVEVFELVDESTGEVKVKAAIPLYFILVDPRQ